MKIKPLIFIIIILLGMVVSFELGGIAQARSAVDKAWDDVKGVYLVSFDKVGLQRQQRERPADADIYKLIKLRELLSMPRCSYDQIDEDLFREGSEYLDKIEAQIHQNQNMKNEKTESISYMKKIRERAFNEYLYAGIEYRSVIESRFSLLPLRWKEKIFKSPWPKRSHNINRV